MSWIYRILNLADQAAVKALGDDLQDAPSFGTEEEVKAQLVAHFGPLQWDRVDLAMMMAYLPRGQREKFWDREGEYEYAMVEMGAAETEIHLEGEEDAIIGIQLTLDRGLTNEFEPALQSLCEQWACTYILESP